MRKSIIIFTIIIVILISSVFIKIINTCVSPILFNYAENENKRISTMIINKSISKELENSINIEELFYIVKNSNDEIQTIDFDPIIVNKILNNITSSALSNFNSDDNMFYELPLYSFMNNIYLSNMGPKIPIKLNIIGNVESNIKTNIKEYGINNALLEVYVEIKISEMINVPFISKQIDVISDVPIAIKLIKGEIPEYYGGSIKEKSNLLSIPIDS